MLNIYLSIKNFLFQAVYPFLYWCKLIRKPLHKMIWGGILAACAFVISGIVELSLLPTYGTPVVAGLAQLRMYNGFNCNFTLNVPHLHGNETGGTILPLSVYEHLNIETDDFLDLPYSLQSLGTGDCADIAYNGHLHLKEKIANSFFVSRTEVFNFTDNNNKAIDSVNVRFLSNVNKIAQIKLVETQKNRTKLTLNSDDITQKSIDAGTYDIVVDGQTILAATTLRVGAVYTINVYQDNNGTYMANPLMITPWNSVHILWLVPQYIVMTMGEVMFSVTGLEFSFTQAPASMKSVLQSIWLLTVAFGNLIVVLIVEGNFLDAQWKEFFLFAGLMLVDMLIFTAMAFRYKYVELKSSTEDLQVEEIRLPEKMSQRDD
ncbi:unnamed protein product [Diatraea saccharalis]|uniref:Uncharacterized protein n=1 Tax=Diatraea saccharalis TaxID=40085 RepID=A0A9N9QKL0_9NEOP|nr:unnamed protein product [Diatraea saccharalis]